MGKLTYKGLVPKDDPMFLTGPELITRPESSASSTTLANDMAGATSVNSNLAKDTHTAENKKEMKMDQPSSPELMLHQLMQRGIRVNVPRSPQSPSSSPVLSKPSTTPR